ncbi:radical SAM protein [Haloglycomyces albus]|uniref:radical SAM protein n=1 Tax=Haloglycomyces albus TaxID=526067 RepID=UPI000A041102
MVLGWMAYVGSSRWERDVLIVVEAVVGRNDRRLHCYRTESRIGVQHRFRVRSFRRSSIVATLMLTPIERAAMSTVDGPEIVHFLLNTDCNAWDLNSAEDSPGVCKFCYRDRNRISSDPATVRRVLDAVAAVPQVRRIVFTGGDPLMPYDNHITAALRHAKDLGFETNVHTNGLLLSQQHSAIAPWIDVVTLALDGPNAATADWFRGGRLFRTVLGQYRASPKG